MKYLFAIVMSIAVLGFSGCKPNTSSEKSVWENRKKEFAEAVTKYPSFKPLLDVQMQNAQKIFDQASSIKNEEEAAKKMEEANDLYNKTLPGRIVEIKYKMKGLEKDIDRLIEKKLPKSESIVRGRAIENTSNALDRINQTLVSAKPTNDAEAMAILDGVVGDLISAQGKMDTAKRAIASAKQK